MRVKKIKCLGLLFFMLFSSLLMQAQQQIKSSEVTPAYLKILCATSGIKVTDIQGSFIKIEDTYQTYLDIDSEGNYILINSEYALVENASMTKILELINRINNGVVLIKASYNSDKKAIEYRYYFWIKNGFIDDTLINALSVYREAISYSLEMDVDKLIK